MNHTKPQPLVSIPVKGLKVTTLLSPAALPADLVPPEPAPAGNPVIELRVEGSPLRVLAILNGKSVRRALKVIAEHGPDNVNVMLQGNLKAPPAPDAPYALDCPGLTATPKAVPAAGNPTPDSPARGTRHDRPVADRQRRPADPRHQPLGLRG
jgi:hypothetical protein